MLVQLLSINTSVPYFFLFFSLYRGGNVSTVQHLVVAGLGYQGYLCSAKTQASEGVSVGMDSFLNSLLN